MTKPGPTNDKSSRVALLRKTAKRVSMCPYTLGKITRKGPKQLFPYKTHSSQRIKFVLWRRTAKEIKKGDSC